MSKIKANEERVLAGATGVITKHAPAIAIELATRDAMYRVHSMLAVYGYTMSGPFCATPTYLFISPTLATNEAILKLIRSDVGELKLLGGEFRSLLRLQEDLQSRLQNAEQRNQATDDKVKAAGQRIAQLEKSLGEVHHLGTGVREQGSLLHRRFRLRSYCLVDQADLHRFAADSCRDSRDERRERVIRNISLGSEAQYRHPRGR